MTTSLTHLHIEENRVNITLSVNGVYVVITAATDITIIAHGQLKAAEHLRHDDYQSIRLQVDQPKSA